MLAYVTSPCHFRIKTLFRLYLGSIQALLRLYYDSIKALLRCDTCPSHSRIHAYCCTLKLYAGCAAPLML
jgi:hypothetical protein